MEEKQLMKLEKVLAEAVQLDITLVAEPGARPEKRNVPRLLGFSSRIDRTTMELVITRPKEKLVRKLLAFQMRRDALTPPDMLEERIPLSRIQYLGGHHTNSLGKPVWHWDRKKIGEGQEYGLTERQKPESLPISHGRPRRSLYPHQRQRHRRRN